jgi:hypothetical protein
MWPHGHELGRRLPALCLARILGQRRNSARLPADRCCPRGAVRDLATGTWRARPARTKLARAWKRWPPPEPEGEARPRATTCLVGKLPKATRQRPWDRRGCGLRNDLGTVIGDPIDGIQQPTSAEQPRLAVGASTGEADAPLPARQNRSVTTSQDTPVRDGHVPARAAWLAWGLCAVSLTLVTFGLVYGAWAHSLLAALADWPPMPSGPSPSRWLGP